MVTRGLDEHKEAAACMCPEQNKEGTAWPL